MSKEAVPENFDAATFLEQDGLPPEQQAPQPDDDGVNKAHEEVMVEKAEKALNTKGDEEKLEVPQKQRPDFIPEKFWDGDKGEVKLEDVFKSYGELEKKFSTKPKQDETKVEEQSSKEGDFTFDYQALNREFQENDGKLSEETYKHLESAGLPRDAVDAFVEGQRAIAARETKAVYDMVGGQENYSAMVDWAATNLTDAEVEAYDNAIRGESPEQRRLAVEGLQAKYQRSTGGETKLLFGDGRTQEGGGFESKAEIVEAMKDPRYANDPAYRRSVERKIAASNIAW